MIVSCSSNPENSVKEGTLNIDPSVTVGDVFNGYKYFSYKTWKSFKDSQNRQIVEFNGKLDFDKFANTELEGMTLTSEMVKKAKSQLGDIEVTYVAQFAISKDGKTFRLNYSGIRISGTNKDTGKNFFKDNPDNDLSVLQNIYANKPEPTTWALLYSIGVGTQ
jgi:hypothetical protein